MRPYKVGSNIRYCHLHKLNCTFLTIFAFSTDIATILVPNIILWLAHSSVEFSHFVRGVCEQSIPEYLENSTIVCRLSKLPCPVRFK
jgi:hypothetical protein